VRRERPRPAPSGCGAMRAARGAVLRLPSRVPRRRSMARNGHGAACVRSDPCAQEVGMRLPVWLPRVQVQVRTPARRAFPQGTPRTPCPALARVPRLPLPQVLRLPRPRTPRRGFRQGLLRPPTRRSASAPQAKSLASRRSRPGPPLRRSPARPAAPVPRSADNAPAGVRWRGPARPGTGNADRGRTWRLFKHGARATCQPRRTPSMRTQSPSRATARPSNHSA